MRCSSLGLPRAHCRTAGTNRTCRRLTFKLRCQQLPPGVVKGIRTTPTPRLDPEAVLNRLIDAVHPTVQNHHHSFYSSELGGIVTEPALMLLHIDDHMVHSGHGVHESVALVQGHVHLLERAVERLLNAAEMAAIPTPWSAGSLMRIVLDTAAASLRMDGLIHMWMTAGRGDFNVSPATCRMPGFYTMVTSTPRMNEQRVVDGLSAKVSQFQTNKMLTAVPHTSLLASALCQREAEEAGADVGLFVDEQGNMAGGSSVAVCVLTQEHTLLLPQEGHANSNLTVERLMELIPQGQAEDFNGDLNITSIEKRAVHLSEVQAAREVFGVSVANGVLPIVSVDGAPIMDGTAGIVSLGMRQLLDLDKVPVREADWNVEVPYGYLTGMRSQLV